jgi:PAS domain S-box-containing protein
MAGKWDKHGSWMVLGALGGWLAAYPMAALAVWGVFVTAPGAEMADLFSLGFSTVAGRMVPVNLISAVLGAGIGLLAGKARRSRQALRESEERFRSMAAAAPDAIVMMDPWGRVTYWNAAAERIFGYSREEALGMNLHDALMPPRYREAFEAGHARFAETGRGHAVGRSLELYAWRRDGGELPIELSVAAIRLNSEWHAMGIVRDITDRKQAEAERLGREKLQGVLEMAGAACHNMNQPLQSVIWHTQALLEDVPEENYLHKELRLIHEQIDKMRKITKKIMSITRYETVDYYKDIKIIDIDKASEKSDLFKNS